MPVHVFLDEVYGRRKQPTEKSVSVQPAKGALVYELAESGAGKGNQEPKRNSPSVERCQCVRALTLTLRDPSKHHLHPLILWVSG
jgi:hypothetical protein